jgi:signal transduction histidine kinase
MDVALVPGALMPPPPSRRDPLEPLAILRLVVAYLIVLFVLDGGKDALAALDGRGPVGPIGFLSDAVPWWIAWVPLLFLGLTAAKRVSPDRVGWPRSLTAHCALSVVLVVAHLFVVAAVFDVLAGVQDGQAVVERARRLGVSFLMPELLTVWGVLALLQSYTFGTRLQVKELEATQLRAAMSEARLEALKRELSPHFLFNALNSVGGLVRENRAEAATEMLDALATLLRRSFDRDDRPEIRLDEELELLDLYLKVEKARWGDALTVKMGIAEGLEPAAVPPLVLQPLVENAIRYGLGGNGTIEVDATSTADQLHLTVVDPGACIRSESPGVGVGLSNTLERLEHLYGDRAGLQVHPTLAGGTRVELSLPLHGVGGPFATESTAEASNHG